MVKNKKTLRKYLCLSLILVNFLKRYLKSSQMKYFYERFIYCVRLGEHQLIQLSREMPKLIVYSP